MDQFVSKPKMDIQYRESADEPSAGAGKAWFYTTFCTLECESVRIASAKAMKAGRGEESDDVKRGNKSVHFTLVFAHYAEIGVQIPSAKCKFMLK